MLQNVYSSEVGAPLPGDTSQLQRIPDITPRELQTVLKSMDGKKCADKRGVMTDTFSSCGPACPLSSDRMSERCRTHWCFTQRLEGAVVCHDSQGGQRSRSEQLETTCHLGHFIQDPGQNLARPPQGHPGAPPAARAAGIS
eukprot:6804257-Pyramimonas_sp.AAC.1